MKIYFFSDFKENQKKLKILKITIRQIILAPFCNLKLTPSMFDQITLQKWCFLLEVFFNFFSKEKPLDCICV